jgi:hypothetical protein
MAGGGSSGVQRSESKVTQSNLPEYVRPYFERLLTRSESESREPYQPFPGARIAGPSRDTLASEDLSRELAAAPARGFDAAYNLYGQQAAYGAPFERGIVSAYDPTKTSYMYSDPRLGGIAAVNDPRMSTQSYLNPYTENVLDVQQRRARDRFDAAKQQRASDAVSAGAFGGSRFGLSEFDREKEFERELSDQEAQQLAQGFSQAQSLAAAQQKYYTDLQRMQYNDAMQRAAEQQARQIAAQETQARLGLETARDLATLDPSLQRYGSERLQLLRTVGAAEDAREQAALDLGYADFARQRDYPRENLNWLSTILQGSAEVARDQYTTTYKPTPNPYNPLLGLGLGAMGLRGA